MRIALMADIHANRQAFAACLEHADANGAKRLVLLGDLVGYGADPAWVLETTAARMAAGAIALLGNHDEAVLLGAVGMTEAARIAIDWTRRTLSPAHWELLGDLPLTAAEDDRFYVHADPSAPAQWDYVTGRDDAARAFARHGARIMVCGHVHVPRLYERTPAGEITAATPAAGVPVHLAPERRWLAVLGAVGQPRDGNPEASYAMLDTTTDTLCWLRVPYDVATAAARIRAAGLPPSLAERLKLGW